MRTWAASRPVQRWMARREAVRTSLDSSGYGIYNIALNVSSSDEQTGVYLNHDVRGAMATISRIQVSR